MPKQPYVNAEIKLAGLDISDHCTNVQVEIDREQIEVTCFNEDGTKEFALGFKSWTASAEVFQNFGTIDKLIWAIQSSTVPSAALSVLPDKGLSKSDDNPHYSGTVRILKYQPINIAVGQVPKMSLNMIGTGKLAKTTS